MIGRHTFQFHKTEGHDCNPKITFDITVKEIKVSETERQIMLRICHHLILKGVTFLPIYENKMYF